MTISEFLQKMSDFERRLVALETAEARRLAVLGSEVTTARVMPVLPHGRRPSWWQDAEIAQLVTHLHRQVEIKQAVSLCHQRFGIERAPSASSLHRYWMKLDKLAGSARA